MITQSLVDAVIKTESNGNPRARSSKGAMGLMQIMPATFNQYADKGMNPDNPEHSRIVGTRYLNDLDKQFNGDTKSILAAYNGGPGRFNRRGRDLKKMPAETQNYVDKVTRLINPIGTANADETPYQGDDMAGAIEITPENRAQYETKQADDDMAGAVEITPENRAQYETNPGVLSQAPDAQPGALSQAQHKAGVVGRGIIEGAAGIPADIYNTAQIIPNAIKNKLGYKSPIQAPESINTQQYGTSLADSLGLPKATENDNIIYPVSKGVGSFALPAAGISKIKTGASIVGNVAKQVPGLVLGNKAEDLAKQSGVGKTGQIMANIAGNVVGGGIAPTIAGIGKMSKRAVTGGLGSPGGLEAVAGRAMNRAAGEESPQVIEILKSGRVPTITDAIPGYKPTTSQMGGNAGVATLLRSAEQDVNTATQLKGREFDNAKSITDYAKTGYLNKDAREALDKALKKKVDQISEPMRERNLPVQLNEARQELERQIARNVGNKEVVKHLQSVLDDMPASGAGYNEVYNFKQSLDEKLRGKSFGNPEIASFKKAGSSLKKFKTAYAKAMNDVEPETKSYLDEQRRGIEAINQAQRTEEIITQSSNTSHWYIMPKVDKLKLEY
jgi:hypothetical protein